MSFLLPLLLGFLGLCVGLLFLISHWKGGAILLTSSGIILLSTYAVWFQRKLHKSRLAYLKLSLMIALSLFSVTLGISARLFLPWVKSLLAVSFWAVLLDFIYVTYVRRPVR